jgi:hypothetical protein
MMRYILIFWALPMSFIWGWYFMSLNDLNLGSIYLSNHFHQLVFNLYGQIIGVDPAHIPTLLARACIFDTVLIFGVLAFRRRDDIRSWWNDRKQEKITDQSESLANLSNAP